MSKLLKKLLVTTAGIAVAVGVGFGAAKNMRAEPVRATDASLSIATYASQNSWVNETAYQNVTIDTYISLTSVTGGNNGKYYSSNNSWRHYEGDSGAVTINASGATLSSATFTYSNGNSGVLKYGGSNKTSGTAVSLSGTTATFSVGHSSGSKNGNVQITQISVSYTIGGGGGSSSSSFAPTTYTVTYNSNGGTGTINDESSPYEAGTTVTVKNSTGFTAPNGKEFTHWYTTQSGTGGTLYNPGDTFTISGNTTLYAQWRDQLITEGTTDTLDYAFTGLTDDDNGYTPWSGKTGTSGAVYSGESNPKVAYIQLRSANYSGIVTTLSGGIAKSISVTWGGTNTNNRSVTIYGKHTAYSAPADLYGGDEDKGTSIGAVTFITNAQSAGTNLSGEYEYIGIKASGPMYMTSISIVWQTISASVVGDDSVDAGSQWSGSVKKDGSEETITGVTYAFAASNGATITSSSTSNGTFVSSTAGTVTVSATKDGCVIANKVVTVEAVVVPTISLTPISIEGYTGQEFSVVANFANLTSAFSWGAQSGLGSISGSVIASTGTSTDGTSTYSGTLTGAGSVVLPTSGGGVAEAPSVTFTITQTTVLLNKNVSSLAQAASETLVATTNVGGVIWTSTNAKVTVTESGVVTVAADAVVGSTATITATSNVDGGVSASCTVTVVEHLLADYLTSSVVPAASVGADTLSWGEASTFSDYTGAVYTARFMGVSSPSFIGRLNDSTNGYIYTSTVPSGMKLKSVSIYSLTAGKTVGVYAQKEAYTAAPSAKGSAIGTIESNSLVYEFNGSPEYRAVCLRGHTSATEIGTVVIEYEPLTAKDKVESDLTTSATLSYHYSEEGGNYSFSSVAIRFGGFMTQDLWDELDTNSHLIAGYGVLLTDNSVVNENEDIADAYSLANGVDVIDYYSGDLASPKSVPTEATAAQKTSRGVSGNYYIWNLYLEVEEANFNKTYVAGAYIKLTNDEVIFMKKAYFSVISLAADYLANRGYDDETAGGSLYKLAHFGE